MKIKRKHIAIGCIIIILVILACHYDTFSKFITDRFTSFYLRSKNFYFSSNLLDTNNSEYQVGTWSGVGNFDISFNLYSRNNEYLFSESDIEYTISLNCSSDVVCTASKNGGTLYASDSTHTDTININVHPERVFLADERVTINVTASSTSPYVKTISARFVYIVGREGVSYEIEDETNRTYLFLKVINDIDYCTVIEAFGDYSVNDHISDADYRDLSTTNKAKCVSQYINVSFNPNDLLLDNTSSILGIATYQTTTISNINYINSLRFAISPNSTVSIKFYKQDITDNNTYPYGNNPSIITVTATDPI